MSNRRNIKNSKQKGFAPAQETEGIEDPIWDFDNKMDVVTVAMQELATTIIKDTSFNLQSYSSMIENSSDALTKSNVCLLIIASFLTRLGMTQSAKNALAQSDSVNSLFASLNLGEKANLNFFCTMVNIMSPEIGKQIETAAFTAMTRMSSKTTVTHSKSRMEAALEGLGETNIASHDELAWASNNSQSFSSAKPWAKMIREAIDDDAYHIPEFRNRDPITTSERMSERDLMRFVRDSRSAARVPSEFGDAFPSAKKPIQGFSNARRQGLGFTKTPIKPSDSISQANKEQKEEYRKKLNADMDLLEDKFSRGYISRKKMEETKEDSVHQASAVLDSTSLHNQDRGSDEESIISGL